MYIINCKDPGVSLALVPWYVPLTGTRLEIGWELHERLRQFPEDTLCGIFYENGIKGMFIAYCRYDDVFIWQANVPKNKYVGLILDTVILWAKARGYSWVRLITNRRRPMKRRFGFIGRGIELEKRI